MNLWKFKGKLLSAVMLSALTSVSYAANTSAVEAAGTVNKPSYYAINDASGFVYQYLSKTYKQGSQKNADILLIGENVTADQALRDQVNQALQANKTVIFDGKGSASKAKELAQAVLGNTIEADAIQFKKAPGDNSGLSMTPILSGERIAQASSIATSQLLESKVANPSLRAATTTNTVENILP